MNKLAWILVPMTLGPLAACSDPNTVLFVTNSSLGINFDSKPPTANIAYDRTEGFIGPRYPNGGTPPAVASIETGGSIFDPKVRQTYATGSAAVKASKGTTAPDGPNEMTGEPSQKKLMFFGTETTLGLKVGFGTGGAPDSLLFGYRRKEASVIPLAEQPKQAGTTEVKSVYPSVLASIEVNVNAKTALTTGLTSKQFFATGEAAENLATSETVSSAFRAKADEAIKGDLTQAELDAAKRAGTATAKTAKDQLSKIMDYVTSPDGSLDKTKLTQLVKTARDKNGLAIPAGLEQSATAGVLRDRIASLPTTINVLFGAIPAQS